MALARIGGALYLIIVALGLFGEMVVRNRIVVSGDAAATAAHLGSLTSLWRLGVAAECLLLTCGITLAMIFWVLLKPVSRDLAVLAVLFNLVSLAVEAVGALFLMMALFPLGKSGYLGAFEQGQREALAMLAVRAHAHGFGIALLFFGWFCVVAGYLIYRAGYLPKAIGVLMVIAGASYLMNSFALILDPALANRLFPAILIPPFIGETTLAVWLLVKGVDVEKWKLRVAESH